MKNQIFFFLVLGFALVFTANDAFAHHVLKEIPVSTSPMKISLTDHYLFVSNLGQREISIIDIGTDEYVGNIVTSSAVVAVKAVPQKNVIYAATFENGGIDVYDLNTKQYIETIELPDAKITVWHSPGDDKQVYLTYLTGGVALDYNPKNEILYVANYNANYVATIDTKTNRILEKIPVSAHPYDLQVDPETNKILVASLSGNEITFLSPTEQGGKIIHSITNTLKTGVAPWGIAIDPLKHLAYVSHRGAHHVTVLDIIGEKIVDKIPVESDTQAISVDTNEHKVYVSYLQENKIVKIDGNTNQILNTIESNALAWDLAIDPESHRLYASMKGNDKIVVMGPKTVAMNIPVVTMQPPVALVGNLFVHGQDVLVYDATLDTEGKVIIMKTSTEDGGKLQFSIPREILDAKSVDMKDSSFMVYADGNLLNPETSVSHADSRFITVQIPKDTEFLSISGTTAIPEFGTVVTVILVASIASVVVVTRLR